MHALVRPGPDQRCDRVMARAKRRLVAQRPPEPAAQLARPHRGRRTVDHARERRVLAPGEARVELEVAPRRRVHRERVVARFARRAVRWGSAPCCVSRAYCSSAPAAPIASVRSSQPKPARSWVPNCSASARRAVAQEMPGRALDDARRDRGRAFGQQQLRGPQALQFGRERFAPLALEHAESARSEVQPGKAEALAFRGERGEQAFAPRIEQGVVGDRAGRHDAHDLALDRAFALPTTPACSQIATGSPRFMSRAR